MVDRMEEIERCGDGIVYEQVEWLKDEIHRLRGMLKVIDEKSLDGYEFMVDCSGYLKEHPNDNEVKNLLFEIRKLVNKVEELEIERIFE